MNNILFSEHLIGRHLTGCKAAIEKRINNLSANDATEEKVKQIAKGYCIDLARLDREVKNVKIEMQNISRQNFRRDVIVPQAVVEYTFNFTGDPLSFQLHPKYQVREHINYELNEANKAISFKIITDWGNMELSDETTQKVTQYRNAALDFIEQTLSTLAPEVEALNNSLLTFASEYLQIKIARENSINDVLNKLKN